MCIHNDYLQEENCTLCKLPARQKAERKAAQAASERKAAREAKAVLRKPKAEVGKATRLEREFEEYEAGIRCLKCEQLRDDKGRCYCDREAQFEQRFEEIVSCADPRAIQGALIRASWDAGFRDTQGEGSSRSQFLSTQGRFLSNAHVGMNNRLRFREARWQPPDTSGDYLPL